MNNPELDKIDYRNSFNINVYSDDRISGTNTNFEISFRGQSLQNLNGKPCFFQIRSVEVPLNSIYQITSGNQRFCFSVDGTTTIGFDIAPGNYTYSSLSLYLKTQMESLDGVANTYTFGYNADQNTITLTPTYASGTLELRSNLNDTRINEILGLDGNLTVLPSATTYTFPYQCNMNPLYYWFICCDKVSNKNLISSQISDLSLSHQLYKCISLSRFSRSVQYITDLESNLVYCPSFQANMRFYILDQYLKPISMDANLEWSLSIRVYFLK